MSKRLFTACNNRSTVFDSSSVGLLHDGRLSREEAIAETRAHFERIRDNAQKFLDTPDDDLHVQVQRGEFRVDVIEVLAP